MHPWAHIVALVDSSDCALSALRIAEQIAAAFSAQLHSAHVVLPISPLLQKVLLPYAALGEDLAEFEQEMVTVARTELRRRLAQPNEASSLHPLSVVCDRIPQGLFREIARFQADLVVMGARGEDGPEDSTFGTTARAVVERWNGPILLTRPSLSTRPIQRIVVASDFGSNPETLLSAAYLLSYRIQAPLAVLTVLRDPRTEERGGLLKGLVKVDARSSLSKGKRTAKGNLERMVKNIHFPLPDREALSALEPELIVRYGEPLEQLQEVVGMQDNMLLIVGRSSRETNLPAAIGSTNESILREIPAHILLVPA